MKQFIILVLLSNPNLLFSQVGYGTTIAYACDHNGIMVAADSKIYVGPGNAYTAPKIVCAKGFLAATSGVRIYDRYNCDTVVKYVADHFAGFDNRMSNLRDALQTILTNYYHEMILNSIVKERLDSAKGVVCSMLVWGSENGKLRLALDVYKSTESGEVKDTILFTDANMEPIHVYSNVFGIFDSVQNFWNGFLSSDTVWRKVMSNKNFRVKDDRYFDLSKPIRRLYYCPYVQVEKDSTFVGMPITAVETGRDGQILWYYNPLNCGCSQ